jgi:ABC-2 type transport system permease protein
MRTFVTRLRSATWLGWQLDSNWTDPFLFLVYTVLRPLATGLILAGIFWAVGSRARTPEAFAGFWLANAFHNFVNQALVGMGYAVVEEREEYETLKFVVVSPVGMFTYLAGRAVVKLAMAVIGVVMLLAIGAWLLHLRWPATGAHLGPLALTLALGVAATVSSGFLVAGLGLSMPRAAINVNEGIMVGLYLLCGVIFPIDLLPRALQNVSLALPFTYWYEALRRFTLGHGASARLGAWSDGTLLAALAASTLAFVLLGRYGYLALERRARRLGRLDQTTLF